MSYDNWGLCKYPFYIAHCIPVVAGEAQKIDRIMEKFAERYCADNPGVFRSADGAYLLAFALVMLNTDAHNPHADGNLGPDDFVGMCQAPVRNYAHQEGSCLSTSMRILGQFCGRVPGASAP